MLQGVVMQVVLLLEEMEVMGEPELEWDNVHELA